MAALSPEARARRRRRVARLHRQGLSAWAISRKLGANFRTVKGDLAALGYGGGPSTKRSVISPRSNPRGTPQIDNPGLSLRGTPRVARVRETVQTAAAPVVLAARLGDLAFGFTEGLRAEIGRLERALVDERRRHAQELAAARAQGDRCRRELEGRLATETARADELQERVVFAERRAEVAISERAALERHVPSSVILNGAVASPSSP